MQASSAPGRAHRPSLALAAAAVCLALAGCSSWYAWKPKATLPPDPDAGQGSANQIALGQVVDDTLHCRMGDCKDWFFVVLDRAGEFEVVVTVPPQESPGSVRLLLEDIDPGGGRLAHSTDWDDEPPLRVGTYAQPGPYYFSVENDGALVSFRVVAKLGG